MARVAEGLAVMTAVICATKHVVQTISRLRASGQRRHEGIVLWLGQHCDSAITVREVYEPVHEAASDYFRLPPIAMESLKSHLRTSRSFVAAQVHSHPQQAFHSAADDIWALVRHEGALSLVAPHFCQFVTSSTFLADMTVFQLNADNRWEELDDAAKSIACQIIK
jgi:hypothetical protein